MREAAVPAPAPTAAGGGGGGGLLGVRVITLGGERAELMVSPQLDHSSTALLWSSFRTTLRRSESEDGGLHCRARSSQRSGLAGRRPLGSVLPGCPPPHSRPTWLRWRRHPRSASSGATGWRAWRSQRGCRPSSGGEWLVAVRSAAGRFAARLHTSGFGLRPTRVWALPPVVAVRTHCEHIRTELLTDCHYRNPSLV